MNNKEIDELDIPSECSIECIDIHELLDNTDYNHIYITSDWHFFKNHYKREHNYVNTQKILSWCRQNIKPDDVFMYLGDISFRYANEEDQKESQRLLASIPGHKILILGNHDIMLGQDYFTGCGFHYVYNTLTWKNIIFTHKPINMDVMPEEYINIHGHIHKWKEYNTSDGQRNINVYPYYFDNKPVTLEYCLKNKDKLIKDNKRSNWTQMGESSILSEYSRANLTDDQFGIPEDRKYPLDTEKHVMSAIKLFGHAEKGKKKSLAKRIKSAANKYDIRIPENTQVYKYLNESDSINKINTKNKFPILTDNGLEYTKCSNIKFWFVDEERNPAPIDKSSYSSTIDLAVSNSIRDYDFKEDYIPYVYKNVFTADVNNKYIWLGTVIIFRDETWEWQFQHPISVDADGYLKDSTKNKMNEWAMAAVNPVIGITKPYILKMHNDCGELINANKYALATDLISDKYLVINENANLEIIDGSKLRNMVVEEYEFIGDKRLIKKIEEAYYSKKIVDNTFFYTALTGKPMLSEDQISFDSNFKKVNFYSMKEKNLTKLATLNESFISSMNQIPIKVNTIPNKQIKHLLGNRSHVTVMEDINGCYVYNTEKNIRSASVEEQGFITEEMINSVL